MNPREDLDRFMTDASRAMVEQFVAESAGESDDVDMDEVVRQNLADHEVALTGKQPEDDWTETGGLIVPDQPIHSLTAELQDAPPDLRDRFHRYVDLSAQALARDLTSLLNRAKDLSIAVCPDVDSDGISYSIEWAYGGVRRDLDIEYSYGEKRWLCSSDQPGQEPTR